MPRYVLWASLLAMLASAGLVAAYEETTVAEGGTITGKVTMVGKVPHPKGYNLTTLPDAVYCGRISDGRGWRLMQPFEVDPAGAFQEVVVFIESIERGKPFPAFTAPRIEAKDCRFLPFISLVRDQHDVSVLNMDPAMHDIQAYETSHLGPRVLFNLPLPISPKYPAQTHLSAQVTKHYEGIPVTGKVNMTKGRSMFVMQCGFHAYMESWGLVMNHPYYTLTDGEGRYQISDVPPGTYKVRIWHPYLREEIEQVVTIEPKGQAKLDLKVNAPTGRLYANQMVENPYIRYQITDAEQTAIVPTLEKQTYQ
jgi:hypothetical protein